MIENENTTDDGPGAGTPTHVRIGPLRLDFESPKRGIPGLGISCMDGEDGEQIGWAEPFRQDDWEEFLRALRTPNKPHLDGEYVALSGDEEVCLVDKLGSAAVLTQPHNELGIVLDIGGRLNKSTELRERRFLMRPGQAAELIADLVVTVQVAHPAFGEEVAQAIAREQERRAI